MLRLYRSKIAIAAICPFLFALAGCGGGSNAAHPANSIPGMITTIAGNSALGIGYSGDGGPAVNAQLGLPAGLAVDSRGNLFILDIHLNTNEDVVRKVNSTGIITTFAGNPTLGFGYSGDGHPANAAQLRGPMAVAVNSAGEVFISDAGNHVIRKVDTKGVIATVAGNYSAGPGYSGDGGPATNAQLNSPVGLAADASGNLFITDAGNQVIRKVDSNGIITTIAGNRSLSWGYSGDGGPAINAQLNGPMGVAVDRAGNLFIADEGNNVIRQVALDGRITTFAGNHSLANGYSGDGALATNAQLDHPRSVAVDSVGNLFIADLYNNVVRKVGTDGKINTVAGNHSFGYSGDGGPATNAGLNEPAAVALDSSGNLFIADYGNSAVRKVNTP